MSTIINTLLDTLPAGARTAYPNEFAAVLEALAEREYELTDTITAEVVRMFGVDRDQVRDQLEYIGMAVRPAPEPVVDPEPMVADLSAFEAKYNEPPFIDTEDLKKGSKKSRLDRLEKQVKSLRKLAKEHGLLV